VLAETDTTDVVRTTCAKGSADLSHKILDCMNKLTSSIP